MRLLTRLEKLECTLSHEDKIAAMIVSFGGSGAITRVRHRDFTIDRRPDEDEESFLYRAKEEFCVSADPSPNLCVLFAERNCPSKRIEEIGISHPLDELTDHQLHAALHAVKSIITTQRTG